MKIISNLPNKYSVGLDEIPIYALKYIANFVTIPIVIFIKDCFLSGIFPNILKNGKMAVSTELINTITYVAENFINNKNVSGLFFNL